MSFLKNIISKIENSKKPFIYFILTFFFITTTRNILEVLLLYPEEVLSKYPRALSSNFLHYWLSYLALALAIILLFYLVTREKINRITRIILTSFSIIIIVPIIDYLIFLFSGKEYYIDYILTQGPDLFLRFFTFFGPLSKFGITPGMRIELLLVLFGSFLYFKIKTQNMARSLVGAISFYGLLFSFAALPSLLNQAFNISFIKISNLLFLYIYLLLSFILAILIFWFSHKNYFINLLKDLRPLRILHFELMFVLGIFLIKVLGERNLIFSFTPENIFNFIFIAISIFLACLFSAMTNNIEDIEIDRITNKTRPSVSHKIPLKDYQLMAKVIFPASLIFAVAVNFWVFAFLLCFMGNYFFYSIPPLRLKKVPIFSKLVISFNSLLLLILGYIFVGGNLREFPLSLTLFFLTFFLLAINFIDIKDYQGDKKSGIKTLPVIFGLRKSKLLIGSFFLIPAIIIPILWQKFLWLIPALMFAGLEFVLINRKNYQEKWVFSLYLTALILLLIYLIIQ